MITCIKSIFLIKLKRVYIAFDYINIPSVEHGRRAESSNDCSSNYISIASEKKPNEYYRLCGNRQGVKLITTYNNVLINFVTKSVLTDYIGAFSLVFRIITDPSARNLNSNTCLCGLSI